MARYANKQLPSRRRPKPRRVTATKSTKNEALRIGVSQAHLYTPVQTHRERVHSLLAASTFCHRPPFEKSSTVTPPSFCNQAFMGKPPNVMCNPSMSSDSSISPISGNFPKGVCNDFTELPSTTSVTGPSTLGIFHCPAKALFPSCFVMDPAGMSIPSCAPSLDTVVRRTSASPIAAAARRGGIEGWVKLGQQERA